MILLLFCTFVATNSGSKLLLDLNGKKYTLLICDEKDKVHQLHHIPFG